MKDHPKPLCTVAALQTTAMARGHARSNRQTQSAMTAASPSRVETLKRQQGLGPGLRRDA